MNTKAWFDRVVGQVETSGVVVQRIVFVMGAQTWHVWEKPNDGKWPEADEWQEEFDTIVAELSEQLPARQHQCLLIAENKNGTTLSQCPLLLTGRNKNAGSMTPGEGGLKTVLEGMQMLQTSWEKTLVVQNAQLELQAKQLQQWGNQVMSLMEYVRHNEEYRATEAQRKIDEQREQEPDPLREQLAEAMPLLMSMAQHWVETKMSNGSTTSKAAIAAAKAVAEETMKGN